MSNHQEASKFVGEMVYQTFLSVISYHRWNSPVKGKALYTSAVDGTYISEPTITGLTHPDGADSAAPDQSQGYITNAATRTIFLVDAEIALGMVCAIYVF
ncbi:hypothetical protein DL768_009544 [Monosporascus sp. mg162]|nr:hypothetical protein DL768_009544 [Monosporascus sp. mg162]